MKRMMAILLAMLLLVTSSAAEGFVPFVVQPTTEDYYRYAWEAVGYGNYAYAARTFADLGDYQDSAELAYLLGVNAYAGEMKAIGENVIAYEFHGQWGLINLDEKVLIAPQWSSIGRLNGLGLTMVSVGDYYGYVNAVGETVIPCEWLGISEFSGGLCTVMSYSGKTYYGLLDATGAVVTPAVWAELGSSRKGYVFAPAFTNERIVVRGEYGYGIMDPDGNLLGKTEWADAPDLTQTYPIVRQSSLYGFIDLDGRIIVPVQYMRASNFSDGLAAVMTTDMLWQYIDPTGMAIIPPVYAEAQSFSGGVAHVRLPGMHWQIINTQGQLVYFLTAQVKADYEAAMALMAAEDYAAAADKLAFTIGYEDSYTVLLEANRLAPLKAAYDTGMTLVAADQLGEALPYLAAASGFKDADAQLLAAQEAIYQRAVGSMGAGDYLDALALLQYIPEYKDVERLTDEVMNSGIYTVEKIGKYGFELNADGYYESTNQGVTNSYAMCTVTFTSPTGYVYIDYINYAQPRRDYGVISLLDGTLWKAARGDTVNVLLNMSTRNSPEVRTLLVSSPAGEEHTITIKYIKDGYGDQNNDSLQFRLRFE